VEVENPKDQWEQNEDHLVFFMYRGVNHTHSF